MKNTSSEISKTMREFKQEQMEQEKQFLEYWHPMTDIVEDLSNLHGIPLYSDDDGGGGGGGT